MIKLCADCHTKETIQYWEQYWEKEDLINKDNEFYRRRYVPFCRCISNMLQRDWENFILPAKLRIAEAMINKDKNND